MKIFLMTAIFAINALAVAAPQVANMETLKKVIELKKDELKNKAPDMIKMLQAVTFKEVKLSEKTFGVKVAGIDPKSALAQIGLQNNDVILGLNDIKFTKSAQGMMLLDQLRGAKDFVLKVQRQGKTEDIAIKIK